MTKWLMGLVIPEWVKSLLIYVLLMTIMFSIVYAIYESGVAVEHERNVAAENAAMAKLAKRNFDLIAQVREVEHQKLVQQHEFTKQFEKRNDDAKITTSHLISRVASGAQQLRIPTKQSPACGSDTNTLGTPPRPAQEKTAELSPAASEFLITFASECDATAEKLNLCIDIAEADRQENSLTAITLGSEVESAISRVIPSSPATTAPKSLSESLKVSQ